MRLPGTSTMATDMLQAEHVCSHMTQIEGQTVRCVRSSLNA